MHFSIMLLPLIHTHSIAYARDYTNPRRVFVICPVAAVYECREFRQNHGQQNHFLKGCSGVSTSAGGVFFIGSHRQPLQEARQAHS